MAEIMIESEILSGMAGEVKYFTRPCPYGEVGIGGSTAMVGSTACTMCRHYNGKVEIKVEGGDIFVEAVECSNE